MFARATKSAPVIPSRNALQALRQLALAGTTVGGLCAVAAITYDAHRRVRVAEKIIENKRTLQNSTPNYDAKKSAKRLAEMMEAAEKGRFEGLSSLKRGKEEQAIPESEVANFQDSSPSSSRPVNGTFRMRRIPPRSPFKFENPNLNLTDPKRRAAATKLDVDATHTEQEISEEEEMRIMILSNQEIEATNRFMELTPRGRELSDDRKELAYQLFAANCVEENTFIARALFEHLETMMTIDTELWSMMMHLLAKHGHLDSVGRIYERHQEALTVPAHLLEVVLRCLLESRRLNAGKKLFFSRIQDDENCGLGGAYLDSLWMKTHSSELLGQEFQLITKGLNKLGRKPTEKLFNPLIKAYIEAGKLEDAEAIVRDMPEKWGAQPNGRTLGLLAYGRAMACDWDGVMTQLREIHSLGFTRDKKDFAIIFDRVFLEYYPSHTGEQTWDFLKACLSEFQMRPDKPLHRHILEALIERGDFAMVEQLTSISQTQNWNTGLGQDDIVKIMNARRVSMQDTPVGAWRMMQAAKKHHGLVATSRRLMGTSAEAYRLDGKVLAPIHHNAAESYPASVNNMMARRSVEVYMPLRKRMEQVIHAGRFSDMPRILLNAQGNGHPIQTIHVQLAAIAAILNDPRTGVRVAWNLIFKEWPSWNQGLSVRHTAPTPRFMPLLFQQISQLNYGVRKVRDSNIYKMALFEFYNICANDSMFFVKHHAAAALARKLTKLHREPTAILVLRAIYLSKWRKSHGFDQVLLKLLMRAYAQTHHARGVWWCIVTVLSRDEPISHDFVVEVQRMLRKLESGLILRDLHTNFPNRENIRVLKRVVQALLNKSSGDPYWSQFKADPEFKRKIRSQPITRDREAQKGLPVDVSVERMITEFDEELEFDLLTRDQHFPGDSFKLELLWDETVVSAQRRVQPEDINYPDKAVDGTKRAYI